jgi:hypothetical protein
VNVEVMPQVMAETQAGQLILPEVVRRLLEVGVESYFCDLASRRETFYLTEGQPHSEKMTLPPVLIAEEFSWSGLIEAIRGPRRTPFAIPNS